MSDTITTLAAKLAEDTMKVMDETGDDRFFVEGGEVLGVRVPLWCAAAPSTAARRYGFRADRAGSPAPTRRR